MDPHDGSCHCAPFGIPSVTRLGIEGKCCRILPGSTTPRLDIVLGLEGSHVETHGYRGITCLVNLDLQTTHTLSIGVQVLSWLGRWV